MAWKRIVYRVAVTLVSIVGLMLTWLFLIFLPNPSAAAKEQYAVYSAYLQVGLTGESHSLGDPRGTVIIAADATMVADVTKIQRLRFTLHSVFNLKIKPGRYRLVAKYGAFGVANVRVDVVGWPSGAFHQSLFVHLRPKGIDTTSFVDRKRHGN